LKAKHADWLAATALCEMVGDEVDCFPLAQDLLETETSYLKADFAAIVWRLQHARAPSGTRKALSSDPLQILIKMKHQADPIKRSAATRTLGRLDPWSSAAIPPLIEALGCEDLQLSAIESLGQIGPPAHEAVPRLISLLNDRSRLVRHSAAAALCSIQPGDATAIRVLVETLPSNRSDCRFAARMLADLGPSARRAVPWLVRATRNADHASHVAAVRALQKIAPGALAEVWPATIDLRAANVPVASRQEELAALWADLANPEALRAYRAVWSLALCPQDSVALLKERLPPARPADHERIARLIADLDSEDFRIRDQATDELQKLGDLAEEAGGPAQS
jgi:HEAT repeat protein